MNKEYYQLYFKLILLLSIIYTSKILSNYFVIGIMLIVTMLFYGIIIFNVKRIGRILKIEAIIFILTIAYLTGYISNNVNDIYVIVSFIIIVFGIIIASLYIKDEDKEAITINIIKMYVKVSIFAAVFGIYAYVTKTSFIINGNTYGIYNNFYGSYAMTSIMQHPNSYGLFCALSLIFSIILLRQKGINKWNKIMLLLNICLEISNLIFTASRTSIMLSGIAIYTYILLFYKGKYKARINLITIIGVMVVVIMFNSGMLNNTILSTKMGQTDQSSGRIDLWISSLKVSKENFLFGVGENNLINEISYKLGDLNNKYGSHNGYLTILTSNGFIVFLMTYVFIIGRILLKMVNAIFNNNLSDTKKMIFSTLIALLLVNMLESIVTFNLYVHTIIFWIILSMNISSNNKIKM